MSDSVLQEYKRGILGSNQAEYTDRYAQGRLCRRRLDNMLAQVTSVCPKRLPNTAHLSIAIVQCRIESEAIMAVVRKDETPFLWFGLMPTKEAVSPESIPHHFGRDAMLARAYMMVLVE